jgi:NAD(P)H-dependent FMN reductase
MTTIAIIIGSTRPRRRAAIVADWVLDVASRQPATLDGAVRYELVDLAEFGLPLLDEETPAAIGNYANAHTIAWARAIERFDGFVFVTPEYNHSTSGALKNAIDFLKNEWHNKAAGFVGYGAVGGMRAVEHLRLIMGELQVADVRGQVALSLFTDWEGFTKFKPGPQHASLLNTMLDQVVAWSRALAPLREPPGERDEPAVPPRERSKQ